MQLVVLVGPKGSGKDTAADILKKQKKVVGSVAFAKPLKRICAEVFDLPINFFADQVFKEKPLKEPVKITNKHLRDLKNAMVKYVDPYEEGKFHNLNKIPANFFVNQVYTTPRQILQQIGTNLIRECVTPNWHCMAAFGAHNAKLSRLYNGSSYAVTDCRFVNEYEYLQSQFPNAYFFYVERPEAEERLAAADHQSELEVLKVRQLLEANGGEVLDNSGSLSDLEKLLKKIKIEKRSNTQGEATSPNQAMSGRFKFAKR